MEFSNMTTKEMLIAVSEMYYEQNLTQQKIAQKLNISRSLVSKMLIKARNTGVVEVIIHREPTRPYKDIEDSLMEKFKLKYVRVVDDHNASMEHSNISIEAGIYLLSRLPACKNVIVSSGTTTRDVANSFLTTTSFPGVTFLPVSGGVGEIKWDIDSNMICGKFAQQCGANYMQIHAPIAVDSKNAKEMLFRQKFIKNVLSKAEKADIALVGIGPKFNRETFQNLYMEDDTDFFANEYQIMGDFCYNFFDKNGKPVDCKWNECLIGLSLDQIRAIPEVICVANSVDKAKNTYIAAKCGLINSLITDVKVAKAVLREYSRDLFN